MVVFGAFTACKRAPGVPGAFWPLLIALALAAAATIGLVVGLDVFIPTPRYLVPVGGMVIGNAMLAAGVPLPEVAAYSGHSVGELAAVAAGDSRLRSQTTLAVCTHCNWPGTRARAQGGDGLPGAAPVRGAPTALGARVVGALRPLR